MNENRLRLSIQIIIILGFVLSVVYLIVGSFQENSSSSSTLVIQKIPGLWRIPKGIYRSDTDLNVPLGINVIIEPGVQIHFAEGKSFLVEETLTAIGTVENPIILTSKGKNAFWRGLTIRGRNSQTENIYHLKDQISQADFYKNLPENPFQISSQASHIEHVIIENVSVNSSRANLRLNYMSSLEILNSKAKIDSLQFKNIQKIGLIRGFNSVLQITRVEALNDQSRKGIHINNSIALVHDSKIEGNQEAHICYDGIWAVNSLVSIQNNKIYGKGDDGIDLKNSFALVSSNSISKSKDEGIDVDHDSYAILINNQIDQADNGIQVSDGSSALLAGNSVRSAKTALLKRNAQNVIDQGTKFSDNLSDIREIDQFVRPNEDQDFMRNQNLRIKTWMIPASGVNQIPKVMDLWTKEVQREKP